MYTFIHQAVPFVGKDAPSHASEYAHPDIAIGLATLAYRCEELHAPRARARTDTHAHG